MIAVMSSCGTTRYYSENTYITDFTQYVNEGFCIYPQNEVPPTLKYTPLAKILIEFNSGKPSEEDKNTPGLFVIKDGNPHTFTDYVIASKEYQIQRLVEEAKKHKANAIIGMKMGAGTIYGLAVKLDK